MFKIIILAALFIVQLLAVQFVVGEYTDFTKILAFIYLIAAKIVFFIVLGKGEYNV